MIKIKQCCLLSLCLLIGGISNAAPLNITYIIPGSATEDYWKMGAEFMQAAAKQLDINLEVIYAERDHIKMESQADEVVNRAKKPDYLIVVNEKLAAAHMINVAVKNNIKTILMLNDLNADQKLELGLPRQKLANWIGTVIPNNRDGGYKIAKALYDASPDKTQPIGLLSVGGNRVTPAGVERELGLDDLLGEHKNIIEKQRIYAEWVENTAFEKTGKALKHFPKEIKLIWTANDLMALGASRAAESQGLKPGQDIFIGGLNWSPDGIEAVKNGKLVTSVGGHFMVGGYTLVMLYDYHNGRDFKEEGLEFNLNVMEAITQKNVTEFVSTFGSHMWDKIDFTKFSKVKNSSIKQYDFSYPKLLTAVNK